MGLTKGREEDEADLGAASGPRIPDIAFCVQTALIKSLVF